VFSFTAPAGLRSCCGTRTDGADRGAEGRNELDADAFALDLHRLGGVRFGDFTLKSGRRSPIYIDLRCLISHPETLRAAGEVLADMLKCLQFDRIAGLPYAGLPLAVSASLATGVPMIYPRKEAKDYGARARIEGEHHPGEVVAVLDDVITDGGAKLELVAPLLDAGLVVRDVVVLVDREQGGRLVLERAGYRLHAAFTLRELLDALRRHEAIDGPTHADVLNYLQAESTRSAAP
jgi:uridine monophosphate synthetase